jgi:uncharacterized protein
MTNLIQSLYQKNLITPPDWLPPNVSYLVIMGSAAYGVSQDSSDFDVYGFCIPPKRYIFPHTEGYVYGLDDLPTFDQYQQHHIHDSSALAGRGRDYDLSVYNIVRYFRLCMDGNPNMVDSLFVPADCVLYINQVGQMVRDNRQLFLSKQVYPKMKGYAYSQLHKMSAKSRESEKRQSDIDAYGYDLKFAYHIVRLLDEVEQILMYEDLDLRRNREQLKSIRRGEWAEQQIREHFAMKERQLESLFHSSTLRSKPDKSALRSLLLSCLEQHYGSLDNLIKTDKSQNILNEIRKLVQ